MASDLGEDEPQSLMEPAQLPEDPMMSPAQAILPGGPEKLLPGPGKPLFLPRPQILTPSGDANLTSRDPTMLSPPSLRAYADRMQADYLRYRCVILLINILNLIKVTMSCNVENSVHSRENIFTKMVNGSENPQVFKAPSANGLQTLHYMYPVTSRKEIIFL